MKGTGVPDILHLMVSHLVIFIVVMHPLRGCVVSSYPITWVLDYSRKAVEQFSIPVHEENLSNQLNHPWDDGFVIYTDSFLGMKIQLQDSFSLFNLLIVNIRISRTRRYYFLTREHLSLVINVSVFFCHWLLTLLWRLDFTPKTYVAINTTRQTPKYILYYFHWPPGSVHQIDFNWSSKN